MERVKRSNTTHYGQRIEINQMHQMQRAFVLDEMLDALLDVSPLESGCILPTIGDGKDCPPHNRRLAAAISASAPPEAWTEDTAPSAATVVAAETDFAFMEREPGESDQPAGRSLIPAGSPLPGQTLAYRSAAIGCIRGGGFRGCVKGSASLPRLKFQRSLCRWLHALPRVPKPHGGVGAAVVRLAVDLALTGNDGVFADRGIVIRVALVW